MRVRASLSSISFSLPSLHHDPLDPTAEPSAGLAGGPVVPSGQLVVGDREAQVASTRPLQPHSLSWGWLPILAVYLGLQVLLRTNITMKKANTNRIAHANPPALHDAPTPGMSHRGSIPETLLKCHRSDRQTHLLHTILPLATTSWHAGRVVRAQRWAGRYRF